MQLLGYVAPSTGATFTTEINITDGTRNPANFTSGATFAVYPIGSGTALTHSTAAIGSAIVTGTYELTVTISATDALTAGNYVVRCTAGSVGNPAISYIGQTVAEVVCNASGNPVGLSFDDNGLPNINLQDVLGNQLYDPTNNADANTGALAQGSLAYAISRLTDGIGLSHAAQLALALANGWPLAVRISAGSPDCQLPSNGLYVLCDVFYDSSSKAWPTYCLPYSPDYGQTLFYSMADNATFLGYYVVSPGPNAPFKHYCRCINATAGTILGTLNALTGGATPVPGTGTETASQVYPVATDTTGAQLATAASTTASAIASAVWGALTASYQTVNTFGAAIGNGAAGVAAAVWSYVTRTLTGSGNVTVKVVNPVTTNANITIYQGDAYDTTTAQPIVFNDNGTWPAMTSGGTQLSTVEVKCIIGVDTGDVELSAVVTGTTPNQVITVTATAAQTAAIPATTPQQPGIPAILWEQNIRATLNTPTNTEIRTLITGQATVVAPLPVTW